MAFSGPVQIFNLNPHSTDSVQQHDLGTLGITADGRKYRYANLGGTAAVAGSLYIAADIIANHEGLAVNTAAVNDKSLTVTLGATAITANEYDEGYVNVHEGAGEGIMYRINSAPAADASASVVITLKDPIKVVFVAGTEVTLVKNKWRDAVVSDGTQADLPVGVANVIIAAGAYGWLQTGGFCSVLNDSTTIVAGAPCTIGDATAGGVEVLNAATEVHVGNVPAGTVAATGEHSVVDLVLD